MRVKKPGRRVFAKLPKRIRPHVRRLYSNNWEERDEALKSLKQLKHPASLPHLEKILEDEKDFIRGYAAIAIAKISEEHPQKAIPILKRALENDYHGVRQEAISALAKTKNSAHFPLLVSVLDDKDSWVENRACKELKKIAQEAIDGRMKVEKGHSHYPIVTALEEKPKNDYNYRRRVMRLQDLNNLQKPSEEELNALPVGLRKYVEMLYDEITQDERHVISSIGKTRREEAIPHLLNFLESNYCLNRQEVLRALGKIGGEKVVPHIARLIKDKHIGTRREAILALGETRQKSAVRHLLPLLEEKDGYNAQNAISALGEIGDKSAFEKIAPFAQDEDLYTKARTAQALAKIDGIRALPYLEKLAVDYHPEVREAAVEGLSKINDARTIVLLAKAFEKEINYIEESDQEDRFKKIASILEKKRGEFVKRKTKQSAENGELALTLVSPQNHPKSFLKLVEAMRDPDCKHFSIEQWKTYAKQLKQKEPKLKIA